MMRRFHLFVSGRVQGVFFRANACRKARSLGLTGWVRNLADGRVEMLFEGEAAASAEMLDWSQRGTPPARVDDTVSIEEAPSGDFSTFDIRT